MIVLEQRVLGRERGGEEKKRQLNLKKNFKLKNFNLKNASIY